MSQSTEQLSQAGKITVLTAFLGVVIFAIAFLANLGGEKLNVAQAGTATTSVTVLNTPPAWTVDAEEYPGSSTTTPTNVGDAVSWVAVATDANAERYYLLICSNNATPTANPNAAPACDSSATEWVVSASTTSGTQVVVSTTTQSGWAESNPWFAWVCDGNAGTPRCNATYKQGTGTTSSPFSVNHRPTFSLFSDDSPSDPGSVVHFYATSSDADVDGAADTVRLFVCNLNDFNTATDSCGPGGTIASSTLSASDPTASYTVTIPTQDQNYSAYGFVVDNHGFEASGGAQGTDSTLTVRNVAPTVSEPISINGGTNLALTVESGQTTGYTLSYVAVDNNSCVNQASTSEITGYAVSLYRSGIGNTTCDATSGTYDPNNCYPSPRVNSGVWNLSCTASTTSCSGPTDTTEVWNCTFPLWYIADPTDGSTSTTQYGDQNWLASVQAVDDQFATGTKAESASGVEVTSFLSFALNTLTIPYGSLQPGDQNANLIATTTLAETGNVGLDQNLSGQSMCPTYSSSAHCPNSATSTIAESNQVYGTSSKPYAQGVALSSTTPTELESNIHKSVSTSTPTTGNTFWGIGVPINITYAGNYTGENTIVGVVGEPSDW